MVTLPEDWEKPRSRGTHLTEEEINQLRVWHNAGWTARDAARELKCSTRTVSKYFSDFGGDSSRPVGRRPFERKIVRIRPPIDENYYFKPDKPKIQFDPVKHREARHYRGNFEL